MKKYLFVFLFSFCFAQEKNDGRFQVVQTERLAHTTTDSSLTIVSNAAGYKFNYLLLDTKTGETFILSRKAIDIFKGLSFDSLYWKPILKPKR